MRRILMVLLLGCLCLALGCEEKESNGNPPTNGGNGNGNGGGNGGTPVDGEITIDHIDGAGPGSQELQAGVPVVFHLRYNNSTSGTITGFSNGYSIWSPNGATWNTLFAADEANMKDRFLDLIMSFNSFSITGTGRDTVGIGGASINKGIPAGFNEVAFSLRIGPIPNSHIGKQICIDSAFYPPGGAWLWAFSGGGSAQAVWNGPYCYTIVGP